MPHSPVKPWFVPYRISPTARARLICFPFAGGGATLYARWAAGLPADVDVLAAELPGRGGRRAEPLATNMESLVEQICAALQPEADPRPLVLFGHSMGAVLAFSCARLLRRRHQRELAHLIVSGRSAPQRSNPDRGVAEMSDAEFLALLRRRGGMAPEILGDPELLALFLPIIRADFCLLDSYSYQPEPPLDCPLTVFGGTRDGGVPGSELEEWRPHSRGPFATELFEGDHFFVNSNRDRVVARVRQILEAI